LTFKGPVSIIFTFLKISKNRFIYIALLTQQSTRCFAKKHNH